jgi:hypothetical protein
MTDVMPRFPGAPPPGAAPAGLRGPGERPGPPARSGGLRPAEPGLPPGRPGYRDDGYQQGHPGDGRYQGDQEYGEQRYDAENLDDADGYDEAEGYDDADGYDEAEGYDDADGYDDAEGYHEAEGYDDADGYGQAEGFGRQGYDPQGFGDGYRGGREPVPVGAAPPDQLSGPGSPQAYDQRLYGRPGMPGGDPAGLPGPGALQPAGVPGVGGDELVDIDDEPSASTAREWLVMATQLGAGAIGGAALWLAFQWLWRWLPVLALGVALVVTIALVVLVRRIRRAEDLQTTVVAVLVGLFVTVSPAALLLLGK